MPRFVVAVFQCAFGRTKANWRTVGRRAAALVAFVLVAGDRIGVADDHGLRAGAAAVVLEADDSMVTSGGIGPGRAKGQEGDLRAVAVVLQKEPFGRFAIVACDVLFVTREQIDFAAAEIERTC
jgi:neutral ceramidase